MRPFTRTIIDLFDSKRRYAIPLYQRQYAWRVEPQLELLWEDIERVAERLEVEVALQAPHFMGAMVIAQIKTFGKEVQAFEVIDGQQRLTTFQLLLAALRDAAIDHSPSYATEASKYLLNEGIMESPQVERFKLWPSMIDRQTFTRIVDPALPAAASETVIVPPAEAAYAFFRERIEQHIRPGGAFDPFKLEKLFEALKDGLAVVSIELEGGDDPQTIFETLNSRGVDLSAADLMRNFIFQRATGLGQVEGELKIDELYEKYWLPLDGWFWKEGETRGRLTRSRLDWLLVDHLSMHKAELISAEALYEGYRRWILNEAPFATITEELEGIAASSAVHRRLAEMKKGDPLGDFGRFARAFDVSTAMPLVLYLAAEANLEERLPEALAVIESYIVRRDICGLPTGAYNRLFVETVAKLRNAEQDLVEALRSVLSASQIDTTRWPPDVEWRRAWLSRPQYKSARQPRLRYIFEAIETRKRTHQSEVVDIKTDLTLEHIMPVKWRAHWPITDVPDLSDDELNVELLSREIDRDGRIHTLGNLTLLTHTLNSQVSNGPFSMKMPALRAQSALVLNRELYGKDKWDEDEIAARGAELFQVALNLWSPPVARDAVAAA